MPAVDPGAYLAATLPVWALSGGAVAGFARAADRLRVARGLAPLGATPDPARVAAAFSSEKLFRLDGAQPNIFAELSGFFPTADGIVRTHANYSHHRARLLTILELPADSGRNAVVARMAELTAQEIEDRAAESGAIAARVRTEAEWAASPQGKAAGDGPLVTIERRTGAGPAESRSAATGMLPLRGVRVLDMTRVIAGPVATRALAMLGAEVLRIDPPGLPEIEWQYLDTCQGKRSVLSDFHIETVHIEELLSNADVLITGYRPGSLDHLVRAADKIRPGIVHGRVSAWGEHGPWGDRRGFDSIVQAASGISLIEARPGSAGEPTPVGALPAQALDHASGYLLAAGVLDALLAREDDGFGRDVRVALARTASWLLTAPGRTPGHPQPRVPGPEYTRTHGIVTTAAPAFTAYTDYPRPAPAYGGDVPRWHDRPDSSE
ncbi:CoA transferase [Nocardia crassostreae]|uniref:CoA transferase n=1 Tax=Nocardia crassostreae TaxID=53428 RepID=UPI0008316308|nr:CoA transferase [Nocardia crassostreae]